MVESRLHFSPLSHILYKPHLNQIMIIITMDEMLFLVHTVYHTVTIMKDYQENTLQMTGGIHVCVSGRSDLVLYGHDRVVLGGIDVQDVVVVLPAQVVGDVGKRGAGRLGYAVVDDDQVVVALGQR